MTTILQVVVWNYIFAFCRDIYFANHTISFFLPTKQIVVPDKLFLNIIVLDNFLANGSVMHALMNRSKKFARKCAKRLDGSSEPSTTDKVGSSDTCGTHSSSLISTIAASCGRQARVEIFRNWRSF